MSGPAAEGPRIVIAPVEAGIQPCARHRERRVDKWAAWRVDAAQLGTLYGKPWGTVSYVCDADLGPWLRPLMVRYAVVEQAPAEPAKGAARANGARPRKKARAR